MALLTQNDASSVAGEPASCPVSPAPSPWLTIVEVLQRIPRPGVVAMIAAAVLFSFNTALAKVLATNRSYSSFQVLYFRGLITCIGCSIALMLARRLPIAHIPDRIDLTLWALGRGALGTVAIGALYFGVAALPLTESVVLFGLNPVFAMIVSKFFLDEPLSWARVGAIPVFLAGVVISADPQSFGGSSNDSETWVRRLIVMVGAACSGSALVFARRMSSAEDLHWAAQGWWQGTVAALCAPVMATMFHFRLIGDSTDVWLLVGMGLCALGGQLCVGIAVRHEHAAIIGVLWNCDMIFSLAWQALMFSKNPQWTDIVGVSCVFLASVLCVAEKHFIEWWTTRSSSATVLLHTEPTDGDDGGAELVDPEHYGAISAITVDDPPARPAPQSDAAGVHVAAAAPSDAMFDHRIFPIEGATWYDSLDPSPVPSSATPAPPITVSLVAITAHRHHAADRDVDGDHHHLAMWERQPFHATSPPTEDALNPLALKVDSPLKPLSAPPSCPVARPASCDG